MSTKLKWLVALVLAMSLTAAITFTAHSIKVNEQKLKIQTQKLEAQTKSQHDTEVQNLKKIIEQKDKELQSKAAEKARIAAENAIEAAKTPVVSKVVQSIVPTAQAATGSHTEWMRAAGISPVDYQYVEFVIGKESGWNPSAVNKSSGACSLAQSLPCSKIGADWQNPVTALRWANSYVARYGGWAGAYQWWLSHSWY